MEKSRFRFGKLFCQTFSTLISASLIWTSSEFAQAAALPAAPTPLINLSSFSIPGNLGMIVDAYRSGNDKRFVLVLQDLHIHPPVQKKIRDLLEFLLKQPQLQNTRVIGVEGAAGPVPTMAEASRPDPARKRKVADFLIDKGELTGAEAYAIEQGRGDLLWGIENDKYYQADRSLYVMTLKARADLRQRLEFLDARLTEVTKHLKQPPAVEEVSRLEKAMEEGMIRPAQVLRTWLKQGADLPLQMRPYPRLRALAQVIQVQEQGTHPELVDQARNFLSIIGPYLMAPERRELEGLAKSDAELFYLRLAWLARERHFDSALPPTLGSYAQGLSGVRNFSSFEVEQELLAFAPEFKAFLTNDRRSQNAFLAQKSLRFLVRYLSQQTTDDEVTSWTRHMQEMIARVKALGLLSNQEIEELTHRISNQIDFYSLALVRNEPMAKNLLAEMQRQNASDTAILVAGGFHTRGITDVLRKEGVSYLVISPEIEEDLKPEYSALYEQRLADNHLSPAEVERGVSKVMGVPVPRAISVYLGGAVRAARVKLGFDVAEGIGGNTKSARPITPTMARSEGRPSNGKPKFTLDQFLSLSFYYKKSIATTVTGAGLIVIGGYVLWTAAIESALLSIAALPGAVMVILGLGLVAIPIIAWLKNVQAERSTANYGHSSIGDAKAGPPPAPTVSEDRTVIPHTGVNFPVPPHISKGREPHFPANVNADRFYAVGLRVPYYGSFDSPEAQAFFDSMELSERDRTIVRQLHYTSEGRPVNRDLIDQISMAFQDVWRQGDIRNLSTEEVVAKVKITVLDTQIRLAENEVRLAGNALRAAEGDWAQAVGRAELHPEQPYYRHQKQEAQRQVITAQGALHDTQEKLRRLQATRNNLRRPEPPTMARSEGRSSKDPLSDIAMKVLRFSILEATNIEAVDGDIRQVALEINSSASPRNVIAAYLTEKSKGENVNPELWAQVYAQHAGGTATEAVETLGRAERELAARKNVPPAKQAIALYEQEVPRVLEILQANYNLAPSDRPLVENFFSGQATLDQVTKVLPKEAAVAAIMAVFYSLDKWQMRAIIWALNRDRRGGSFLGFTPLAVPQ